MGALEAQFPPDFIQTKSAEVSEHEGLAFWIRQGYQDVSEFEEEVPRFASRASGRGYLPREGGNPNCRIFQTISEQPLSSDVPLLALKRPHAIRDLPREDRSQPLGQFGLRAAPKFLECFNRLEQRILDYVRGIHLSP